VAGYVALALGRRDLAEEQVGGALRSGCFETVADRIARDLEACGRPTARAAPPRPGREERMA